MDNKKDIARFTIQFNLENPIHAHVVEVLNRQNQRGKARYIANAIQHYQNCDRTPDVEQLSKLNENAIEAIVERILCKRGDLGTLTRTLQDPIENDGERQSDQKTAFEVIELSDSLDDIDEGLISNMLASIEMLKQE